MLHKAAGTGLLQVRMWPGFSDEDLEKLSYYLSSSSMCTCREHSRTTPSIAEPRVRLGAGNRG